MKSIRFANLFIVASGLATAQPVISFIENAATNIPAPLPNSAIAQGAKFVIKGVNLGPATLEIFTSFPYGTSVGGVSGKVTVGGQIKDLIMFYTSPLDPKFLPLNRQIGAILPSSTPPGSGNLTITYNGQTSAPAAITVVANNIGLYTLNTEGTGAAVATFQIPPPGGSYVSNGNAAREGDAVILWGTGLGSISGDEKIAAPGGDMTNVPLEVFVGGQTAQILYRGRNGCCNAVDTVYFRVPAGPSGCMTPVTMKIGNMVSNTATIPIAATGRVCMPSKPGITQNDLDRVIKAGGYTTGNINLTRLSTTTTTTLLPGLPPTVSTIKSDIGSAGFFRVTGDISAAFNTQFESASYGACVVYSYSGQTAPDVHLATTALDAGASIDVNGPKGPKSVSRTDGGLYFSGFSTAADYLDAGSYTVSGPGGVDVPAFSAQTTMPPALLWTNQAASTSVTRASGAPITWTGGDPNGFVQITGTSFLFLNPTSYAGSTFICTAKTSAGGFTVPAIALLALPASGTVSTGAISLPLPGILGIAAISATTVSTPGLDFLTIGSQVGIAQSATYR